MTIPSERTRALIGCRDFLKDFISGGLTKTAILDYLRWVERHFPNRSELFILGRVGLSRQREESIRESIEAYYLLRDGLRSNNVLPSEQLTWVAEGALANWPTNEEIAEFARHAPSYFSVPGAEGLTHA